MRPVRGGSSVRPGERGAVTAELVMVLPLLVVVTAGLAWLLAVGADQLRLVDAAREVARGAARGDAPADAVALGRRVAPVGARFDVRTAGGLVTVQARAPAPDRGLVAALLPEITLRADAVALAEEEP